MQMPRWQLFELPADDVANSPAAVPRMEADRKATALRQEVKGAEVLVERLREEIADLRSQISPLSSCTPANLARALLRFQIGGNLPSTAPSGSDCTAMRAGV